MSQQQPIFSVITPSGGSRPLALFQAISSVATAITHAASDLPKQGVEMLVGYDGVKGPRTAPDGGLPPDFVRFFDLPYDGNFGNAIRQMLLRAARGRFVLFVDDDNTLSPEAFNLYLQGLEHDMQVGRIDVSRAFDIPFLPRDDPNRELISQGNIDPLCLCLSHELITIRCDGWHGEGGYESDFLNIRRYARRAKSIHRIDQIVGIYDANCGLDSKGLNPRQIKHLDRNTP